MKQNYTLDIDFQSYNTYNSMHFNRLLAHAIGAEEALIYSSLLSKYLYYGQRDMLDNPDGWFFVTEVDLQESTTYKEKVQRKAIKHLVESGLIEYKLMGLPAKRYFRIVNDRDNLHALEEKGLAISKEIYTKTTESNMLKKSKNAENSSSAKMAELDTPNGRNLTLPKGGTCTSQMAEHTYNHNINNHNIKNLNLSQSVSDFQQSSVESFQQSTVENFDRQTDGYIPKKEKTMSYAEMLEAINCPLQNSPFDMYDPLTEDYFEPFDENDRRVQECTIPYTLVKDKKAFGAALKYLMAYSYRYSEYEPNMKYFIDSVLECLTEIACDKNTRSNRVMHYYEVIDGINEINKNNSLMDWILSAWNRWVEICQKKQSTDNPIRNKKAYLKLFLYDYLKEYKINDVVIYP